jgi:hypothetical protein
MSDASLHTPPQPGDAAQDGRSEPDQEAPLGVEAAETSAPMAAGRSRRGWKVAAVLVSQLLLLGLAGAAGYLAWTNHDRADGWKARAVTLDRNVAALNDVLVERSETLNERTRELNLMAAKVRESQGALRRSEADVASLARRQRELANEKAQVEDERAEVAAEAEAVEGVAGAFIDCKSGLVDLLGYIANDDYYSANYYWDSVSADCSYAEESLSNYLGSYGG